MPQTVLLLLFLLPGTAVSSTVTAWNYHPWPPFHTGKNEGLSQTLISLLNEHLPARQALDLESIERRRLNNELTAGASGVVLLANPAWFGDRKCEHYLVSPALMWVRDELVSLAKSPVNYRAPNDLFGLRLAFLQGFKLVGLTDHINAGRIQRIDSITSESNLTRMLRGQVDVAVIPRTQVQNLKKLDSRFHVSDQPLHRSTRHLLFTPDLQEAHAAVMESLRSAQFRQEWRAALKEYGMELLILSDSDLEHDPAAQTCEQHARSHSATPPVHPATQSSDCIAPSPRSQTDCVGEAYK